MGLLSGLKKSAPVKEETKRPEETGKTENKEKEPEKKAPVHEEIEFLFAKTVHCPVCDCSFRSRTLKSGRARRLDPDFDLRPRFAFIDTNKYDVSSCPKCGYTAINRYFENLTGGQIRLLEQEVKSNFKPDSPAQDEALAAYTYEEAFERYRRAMNCTRVKRGRASEAAYECLKLSWLYRGKLEALAAAGEDENGETEELRKQEQAYYEQAYEGFIKAIASENFPMCGMEENTLNLLLASMAYRLEKYDVASKLVSSVLTSQVAARSVKDRAMDLKELIVEKLHRVQSNG